MRGDATTAGSGSATGATAGPNPNHPLWTGYENYVNTTPFVTRCLFNAQVIGYVASWFADTSMNGMYYYAVSNIPYFVLWPHCEIYRLVVSSFILFPTNLFALLFTALALLQHAKVLEESIGSMAFAWLCITLGVSTNILFFAIHLFYYLLFSTTTTTTATSSLSTDAIVQQQQAQDQQQQQQQGGPMVASSAADVTVLFSSSAGIWTVLFGLVAMECTRAAVAATATSSSFATTTSLSALLQQQRRFLCYNIPLILYPAALLLFLGLLGGASSSSSSWTANAISLCLGYLYSFPLSSLSDTQPHPPQLLRSLLERGQKITERIFTLPPHRIRKWEETNLTTTNTSTTTSTATANTFSSYQGWVPLQGALGNEVWTNAAALLSSSGSSGPGTTLPTFFRMPQTWDASGGSTGSSSSSRTTSSSATSAGRVLGSSGAGTAKSAAAAVAAASNGGIPLGGDSASRRHVDARQARLEALERRQGPRPYNLQTQNQQQQQQQQNQQQR